MGTVLEKSTGMALWLGFEKETGDVIAHNGRWYAKVYAEEMSEVELKEWAGHRGEVKYLNIGDLIRDREEEREQDIAIKRSECLYTPAMKKRKEKGMSDKK